MTQGTHDPLLGFEENTPATPIPDKVDEPSPEQDELAKAKQEIERLKEEIHKLKFPGDYPNMW